MRKFLLFIFLFFSVISGFTQNRNVELLGHLAYASASLHGDLSDIWGHVDSLGNEYAIIGLQKGVSIVDVTDPNNLNEVFYVSGPSTIWRDVKTWDNHAYITNEASGGLQIIDLSALPGSITPSDVYYHSGTNYPFTAAHNLYIDENGIAYIFGADYNKGGAIFLDLNTDPKIPQEVGVFDSLYFHDGMVRGDTLWGAAVWAGQFFAIDVSNKANPIILRSHYTSGIFAHNCWISDDGNTLFTTDEISGGYISSYDVSDLSNIEDLDIIQSSPGGGVIPHNTHVFGDFLVTSYYKDGVTIVDVTEPDRMVQIGNYDTAPLFSGTGFRGCWGVYPYLPSGNVIASDIDSGLFVLGVNYAKGVYIKGNTRSFSDSSKLALTLVTHVNSAETFQSNLNGFYKESYPDSGWHQFAFRKAGYLPDTLTFYMQAGQMYNGDVYLRKDAFYTVSGTVFDASSNKVPGAKVVFDGIDRVYSTIADADGYFEIDSVYEGPYQLIGSEWTFENSCNQVAVTRNDTFNIYLQDGYYDDFAVDNNWTVNSSSMATNGVWEIEYLNQPPFIAETTHPLRDVLDDCSKSAYVTGSFHPGDHDVDGYTHELISPLFDPVGIENAHLHLSYWFLNDAQSGSEDSLNVYAQTQSETITLMKINNAASIESGKWMDTSLNLVDFDLDDQTFNIHISVGDYGTDDHLEVGIDHVFLYNPFVSVAQIEKDREVKLYPNPINNTLYYSLPEGFESSEYMVIDPAGRIILSGRINELKGQIEGVQNLPKGLFVIRFTSEKVGILTGKLLKN